MFLVGVCIHYIARRKKTHQGVEAVRVGYLRLLFPQCSQSQSVAFPIEAFRIHLRNFFSRLGFVFRVDGHRRFPGLGDFNPIAFHSVSLVGKRVASVGSPNMTWGSSSPKQSGQTRLKKSSRRIWPVELSVPQREQTGRLSVQYGRSLTRRIDPIGALTLLVLLRTGASAGSK
jgi:hypothetical protein